MVFRLIIITLLMILVKDIMQVKERWSVALAVVVSSLLFAAHHYQPIGADVWSIREFAFRTAAGAYLAAVFVVRGFGLAVGCHVIYDVMAFLL
jgi:membrane protease YdiL (CAAX protease family)